MIDRACIERMVTLANLAPSAENCQPWRFRWDGHELTVHHDAERARHQGNRRDHLSLLSLGGVLQALEIAAGAERLAVQVQVTPEQGAGPWATVELQPGADSTTQRAEALKSVAAVRQRATDRRLYRGGSIDHPVFTQLARDALAFENCHLHVLARPPEELLQYLAESESYVVRHDEVFADVLRWIRFSQRDVELARDGVPWRALGFDLPSLRALELLGRPRSWRLLRKAGLLRATRAWLALQLSSSAALCAITVRPGSREHLVSAGRLAFRTWTALQRAGFGVQPMTVPSLFAHNSVTGDLPPSTSPEFARLFRQGDGVLRRAFGSSEEELPIWLMRTGLSEPLPARLRTPRLATSSILTCS